MIKHIIKDKLREKKWTFGEIADVSTTVNELAEYAYETMTAKEKLDLVWYNTIGEGIQQTMADNPNYEFGEWFSSMVMYELKKQIAIIIKDELSDATVMFKEDNKNEVSETSVGGEPHKERTSNEANDSEE